MGPLYERLAAIKLRLGTQHRLITLIGCGLFALSTVLPVMRWGVSSVHPTSGSARAFGASDWTLLDGGFPGAALVPFSVVAVVMVAVATLATRLHAGMRWVQIIALGMGLYYPFWILYVFGKKWEDQVFPAEGVAVLIIAFAAMLAGTLSAIPMTWLDRRRYVTDSESRLRS